MRVEKVQKSSGFETNIYYIDVTPEMREKALEFAMRIVYSDNQYSRLLPREVWNSGDVGRKQRLEIQRTYVGKVAELAFAKLLWKKGKQADVTDMFTIYSGQNNVDNFDFVNGYGHTVDVKAGFRTIHQRLLVNVEQFDNIPKNYYVGIKLNGVDLDAREKIIDLDSVTVATVHGYAEYEYMKGHAECKDYGEGMARSLRYSQLMGIDRLLDTFWERKVEEGSR